MNNNQGNEFIYCSRCGEPMRANQRCCIKCGNINFNNSDNDSMIKYAKLAEDQNSVNNQVNENYTFVKNNNNSSNVMLADKIGSLTVCVIFNILLYLVCLFGIIGAQYFSFGIDALFRFDAWILAFCVSLCCLINFGLQMMYTKANKPWYSVFIPFYGNYVFFDMAMDRGFFFLLLFIPVVGQIFMLIATWKLAKRFDKSPILAILFYPVFVVSAGLNVNTTYDGISYVPAKAYNSNNYTKFYKPVNGVVKLFCSVMVICALMIGLVFLRNFYLDRFKEDSLTIVDAIKNGNFEYSCSNNSDVSLDNYYIRFDDFASELNIQLSNSEDVLGNRYSGYIYVSDGKYYVSMSNGFIGILDFSGSERDIKLNFIKDFKMEGNPIICELK